MKLTSQKTVKKKRASKKLPMAQKTKLHSALKLRDLTADTCRGVFSIISTQRCIVREKALVSTYSTLKKYTKKLGLFWIKPVRIKVTTTKSNKRMGKGKGAQITYNRHVVIPAGMLVFEIGPQNNLKSSTTSLKRIFTMINAKLPFKFVIRRQPGLRPIYSAHIQNSYTYQK